MTPIDLPSGMPPNAISGPLSPKEMGPDATAPKDLQTADATAPTAVIFNRAIRPFPVVIKGLNFDALSYYLSSYEMGMYRFIVRIWDLMRKRDEHLLSVSSKRMKRTSRLEWEIIPNDSTPAAIAQAEFLSDFMADVHFKRSGDSLEKFGLQKSIRHLMTALANGFAACEIEWMPGAGPKGEIRADLIKVRSDFFDETTGAMCLFTDSSGMAAIPVPEFKLLIHRSDEALMIASSILFVMKQIALGQWNDFCDTFGMPGLVGTAPDGASQASREELLKLLQSWRSKLAAVLPPGYLATVVNGAAGMSGGVPSQAMVARCEDAMSILWMGGNLSTKSQSGSGTLAGGAQRDQEIEMTEDDAEDLGETINAQLCAPAVLFQFGQPLLCQFKFKIAQTIDLAASIGVDVALVNDLGLELSEADLRAKYGWRKPDAGEDVIKKAPAPASPLPLPVAPSLRQEASGDGGTALKAGDRGGSVHQTDAIADAHAPQGREALKALFAEIEGAIGDVGNVTPKELESRLKNLQGKLSTDSFQNVIHAVIEKAFDDGSKTTMMQTMGGQG